MDLLDLLASSETILGLTSTGNAPDNSAQFRMPRGTLVFLQLAYAQAFSAIGQALIGPSYNAGNVYILYGCNIQQTVTASPLVTVTLNRGAIFYNGEILVYNGAAAPTTLDAQGQPILFFSIKNSPYTGDGVDADPVTYTDGSKHNIHTVREAVISSTGPGIGSYSTAIPVSFYIPAPLNLTGTGSAAVSGVYPNININAPVLPNLIRTAGTTQINAGISGGASAAGDVPGGNGMAVAIIFNENVSLADTNYYVMGAIRGISKDVNFTDGNTVTNASNATVTWDLIDSSRTINGFSIQVREFTNNPVQDVCFDYIVFSA